MRPLSGRCLARSDCEKAVQIGLNAVAHRPGFETGVSKVENANACDTLHGSANPVASSQRWMELVLADSTKPGHAAWNILHRAS